MHLIIVRYDMMSYLGGSAGTSDDEVKGDEGLALRIDLVVNLLVPEGRWQNGRVT